MVIVAGRQAEVVVDVRGMLDDRPLRMVWRRNRSPDGKRWTLTLEGGHTVKRTVRYWPQPSPQRGGTQHRSLHDVLPAAKHVRCEQRGPP